MKMMTGLYCYNRKLFYGQYDEQQVSGRISCKIIKADSNMTNREIGEDEFAVKFFDNHSFLEAEGPDFLACLNVAMMLDGRSTKQCDGIVSIEKLLPVHAPLEFVNVYEMICDCDYYFTAEEHFIRPNELSIEKNIIGFFAKKNKPVVGLDIQSGRLARYGKGEWTIENGDISFFRFSIMHILLNILERQNIVKKGRLKGSLVSALNIEKALDKNGTGNFHILRELGIYGVAVLYDDNGTIVRIRSNGTYGDVYIGAKELQGVNAVLDMFKGNLNLMD